MRYNDSRVSYFPVDLGFPSLVLVYIFGVVYCCKRARYIHLVLNISTKYIDGVIRETGFYTRIWMDPVAVCPLFLWETFGI